MPIYLFRCPQCEHEFRELLWPTEPEDAVRCPECHARPEKQPAGFAVRSGTSAARATEQPPPFCGRCGQNRAPCDG